MMMNLLPFISLLLATVVVGTRGEDEQEQQQVVDVGVGEEGLTYPSFRYVPWEELDESLVAAAEALEYTEETWNTPGQAEIESLSYETITLDSPDIRQQALDTIGYDNEEQWDCYINHYDDYDWEELEEEEVQQYYAALGWTEESWLGDEDPPESEDMDWAELNDDQQAAASELCYFEQNWDGLSLDEWPSSSTSTDGSVPLMMGLAGVALLSGVVATLLFRHKRRTATVIDLSQEGTTEANFQAMI